MAIRSRARTQRTSADPAQRPGTGDGMRPAGAPGSDRGAASRMLQILATFNHTFTAGTMKEIAARTAIPESTLFRLLGRLSAAGMLWHDAANGRYGPGLKLVELGDIALRQLRVPAGVERLLDELQAATNETASFSLWRGGTTRTIVAVSNSLNTLREFTVVGETHELWLGASGKAIAAFIPRPAQEDLARVAETRGADGRALLADLAAVAAEGIAITEGERIPGVMAASAPVYEGDAVVGSVTVSGPAFRVAPVAREHAAVVRRYAAEITAILGQTGSGIPSEQEGE